MRQPDNQKIVFTSDASKLVPGDTNGKSDVFVKDLASGVVTRVSTAADGSQGNDASSGAMFSPDGSKIAFTSDAWNLIPGDTNEYGAIFIKDLASGDITRVALIGFRGGRLEQAERDVGGSGRLRELSLIARWCP
jgi:Tol biopolymer transport system component